MRREYKKKPDLNTKTGKYFLARRAGKNKKEAAIEAGYNPTHTTEIEASKTYQAIEKKYYKDILLQKLSMEQIAEAHADNILQNGEEKLDRAARNKAIEIALDKIEPEEAPDDSSEAVVFVLKK